MTKTEYQNAVFNAYQSKQIDALGTYLHIIPKKEEESYADYLLRAAGVDFDHAARNLVFHDIVRPHA